ncbi:hypothetical protein DPSP01_010472 [Paraphaeosphaeria sporulosa]|uniref:NAD(P)-binding protein n=1 Tax=Paraphaeosphaeria sporulosa TaxID=1460663 RepID=A0A177BZ24_9PLEO|nr:NAD(P)-binding protein [Paraphaeosphaeria sporulosa]OAF99881.1 NAD(P)-binding protein [Paraphaeosphaeria sporulosa]
MVNNRINKVAIVGATGHIGSHIVAELLKNARHEITAISRQGSKAKFPSGVKVAQVDYSKEESIIEALCGHDFLIISLSTSAAPETHPTICKAAVKAGIHWIMPNAYGMDINNVKFMEENVYGPVAKKAIEDVKAAGGSFINLACSFWYEWSLGAGLDCYGIDVAAKKAILFDDGTQKINTSTLTQCGRAVSALLNLPITKDNDKPALEDWKDNAFYVSSFLVSQRDMLDSVHRVLGDSDEEWEITSEPVEERVKTALQDMYKGNYMGWVRAMYTRFFHQNGDGNFESRHELANERLGLPKEDLDAATKWAVEKQLRDGFVYER